MRRSGVKLSLVVTLAVVAGAALLLSRNPQQVELIAAAPNGGVSVAATYYRPRGPGPFPAVVLLHGCAGVLDKHRAWTRTFVGWGYAVLIVDSFSSRGIERLCESPDEDWQRFNDIRPADAVAGLAYLAALPEVDAERVGLIGWSYGGTIVLEVLDEPAGDERAGFRAGIAFYPSCWQFQRNHPGAEMFSFAAPLMILHGAADDWTLPQHCESVVARAANSRHPVSMQQFPEALHDFDNAGQAIRKLPGVRVESDGGTGDATVGHDRTAHDAAKMAARRFLGAHLSPE